MKGISLEEFYQTITAGNATQLSALLPTGLRTEFGHFNVFSLADLRRTGHARPTMTFDRRAFYKIGLISGPNRVEYADKVIEMKRHALLFSTPRVPYHWLPQSPEQAGQFCIFTPDFLLPAKSGLVLDELPLYQAGGYPVFELSDEQYAECQAFFTKMQRVIASDYPYKHDLLRAHLLEIIHFGQMLQMLQPAPPLPPTHNASARVTSLFIELLERQFPLGAPRQQLRLRTATDYADALAIHVNHLNKVLKETTGRTTTEFIAHRLAQEAKVLLRQTNWTVSEIAAGLGFTDLAHFSNAFKRQTSLSPVAFRLAGG